MKSRFPSKNLSVNNIDYLCKSELFNIFFFLFLNADRAYPLNRAHVALVLRLFNCPVCRTFTNIQCFRNLTDGNFLADREPIDMFQYLFMLCSQALHPFHGIPITHYKVKEPSLS